MELGEYLRVLRASRTLVVACVVACVAASAALAWLGTQQYNADTQLFVSVRGGPDSLTVQGQLYVQQRANAFAALISGQGGAEAAVDQLKLSGGAGAIDAAAPGGSAAINVTVSDPSSKTALSTAQALDRRLPPLLDRLDTPKGGQAPLNVSVTEPARVSAAPVTPRKPFYLALGAVIGLAIGVMAALLRNALDRRVKTDADATVAGGAPVLAGIPRKRRSSSAPTMLGEPLSVAAEKYRQLRASVRAVGEEHEPRSLLVSSAVAREGKTEIVANLGLAMAQAGERVLVVDANLRSPELPKRLGMQAPLGLTDVLDGTATVEEALRRHPTAELELLASGTPHGNPGELVDSPAFAGLLEALGESFDLVILDSPALLSVADARALARWAPAVLLVARAGSTRVEALRAASEALRRVERRPLGIVLNRVTGFHRRTQPGGSLQPMLRSRGGADSQPAS